MRKPFLAILPVLLVAGCMTAKPDTKPYAGMDCPTLESKRVMLVAELDALPASEAAKIEKTRAEIEAVGVAQVEKGCAG